MKYLLLLPLLAGCSLIQIKEAPQPEKHRPQIITVTAYGCLSPDSAECKQDMTLRFSRDKITFYADDREKSCYLQLAGPQFGQRLKMTCSELDELLNQ